jgi:hypothetical protein
MNKNQKHYIGIWAVLLVLFNAIAFISPGWITHEKYTASFWIGYVFITISFVGQLICALSALKEQNLTKLFYKIPLIRVSYTGLIVSFVVGGACMLISPLPYWIGALAAVIVLAVTAISVLKANAAADIVADIDEKISHKTFFIRNLTADAEGLLSRAKTPEDKAVCKKVYEALRYSDPMSSNALTEIEKKIEAQFTVFSKDNSADAAEELLLLIGERNRKCKALK